MAIAKWSVVAVTLLMGLANLGLLGQDDLAVKILGPLLAAAAVTAVLGLLTARSWGLPVILTVGVVNLLGALISAVVGLDGWPIGLVLSVLAVTLASVYRSAARGPVTA